MRSDSEQVLSICTRMQKPCKSFQFHTFRSYLREIAIVESGHNQRKAKSAVEEVGQRQVENQDGLACVQLRDFIWVPFALL